jgi:hypothetical protein
MAFNQTMQQSSSSKQGSREVLGFKPIGYLQTCFTTRWGQAIHISKHTCHLYCQDQCAC